VHEHGLAASQLLRLRARGIPLTIAVDKVAASGGYLMACAADRIVAAPYAILGSIGVLVQLPNFHRLLEEKGVDFEQITAGRYKRTLTLFGENTDEGREKMKKELVEVHELFQKQVSELRPIVDLEQVATGEHWYGSQALELKLIDEIGTSDDYLLKAAESADVFRISYRRHRKPLERMLQSAEGLLYR
jgi:serine protease SohB